MTEGYRVQLDVFSGPLDLLLYLIRRDELDIQDISIARVTEQYIEYAKLLEQLDPNAAGEFLVTATTLVELKSRALLPTPPLEAEGDEDDPRTILVKQLLEYKRFKDAARALGKASDDRAKRYARRPANLPRELQGVELEEAQVWDLLAAFGRVMSSIGRGPGLHEVLYDETPIEVYEREIIAALERDGPSTFQTLFKGRTLKAEIIGLFLALLELIRKHSIRVEQEKVLGALYLFLLEEIVDDEGGEPAVVPAADDAPRRPVLVHPEDEPSPTQTEDPTEENHGQTE